MLRAREKQAAIEHSQIKELIAEIAHQMRMPLANLESYTEGLKGCENMAEALAAAQKQEKKPDDLIEYNQKILNSIYELAGNAK